MVTDRHQRRLRRFVVEAAALVGSDPEDVTVIVAHGVVQVLHPEPSPPTPGQLPVAPYDSAIVAACTDSPLSPQRIATAGACIASDC